MIRTLLIGALVIVPVVANAQAPARYAGLPLGDALRLLQARGLRIVFSSRTVTPALRVAAEPRGRTDRERLDELLAPHGLRARAGPGGTLLIVRGPIEPAAKPPPAARAPDPPTLPARYHEAVRVEGTAERGVEPGVPSQISIARGELSGLQAVATDDLRSEVSLRGSPYRHVGVVIDGVATRRMVHTAYGRGGSGSLSMLHGDAIARATVHAGAYPQPFGATLGGELLLAVREGSRERRAYRAAINGSSASATGEGPLDGGRGSWLVSLRQSYRSWPRRRGRAFDGAMFGFTDALGKMVYDLGPRHQLAATVLAGRSHIDELDGALPYQPGDGLNRTEIATVALRSTLGSHAVLTQRASSLAHEFENETEAGQVYSTGRERELSYRADVTRQVAGGLLSSGGHIQRTRGSGAVTWSGAAYAHYRWRATPRVTVAPGLRAARSGLTDGTPVARWLLGELMLDPRWTLRASAGSSYQLPQLEYFAMKPAGPLAPERAVYADVGLSRRIGDALRFQATLYRRRERDVLRPDAVSRLWENALDGSAHGVELLLEGRGEQGVSGWLAYSFGKARYTDTRRHETFWGEFDQRHAVNAHAIWRLSDRAHLALTFRSGTNFPVPAAYRAAAGDPARIARAPIRLRPYARLDVRAGRSFSVGQRRVTLFVEVLNVLDRANEGLAAGGGSGDAAGLTQRLMPRLPSAGLVIEF